MKEAFIHQMPVQDAVHELGNIGIGAAGTALSMLINQPVMTSTEQLQMIEDNSWLDLQLAQEQIVGILFPYDQDVQGYGLFLLEEEFACRILQNYLGQAVDFSHLGKEHLAVLQEICSIMASSYLSALAEFAKLSIRIQPLAMTKDMKGSIVNDGFSYILQQEKEAFWLNHTLFMEKDTRSSHLLFMMTIDSIRSLMEKLEVVV